MMSLVKRNRAGSAPVLRDFEQSTSNPQRICERLAKTHYENFAVGSLLLPRRLRRHIYNIYAYCRVCDDLADETNDPELSLRLLDWWREELHLCFEGRPRHQVFIALAETVSKFDLPIEPFEDLISAFIQDQTVTRYATYDQLLDYCSRSANPVGRLFLCMLGYTDETRRKLADCTCTALQLANFWQDIGADHERGAHLHTPGGHGQVRLQRSRAAKPRGQRRFCGGLCGLRWQEHGNCLNAGPRSQGMIDGAAAADVGLFTSGGMAVLRSIERGGFRVFRRRITVSKSEKTADVDGLVRAAVRRRCPDVGQRRRGKHFKRST